MLNNLEFHDIKKVPVPKDRVVAALSIEFGCIDFIRWDGEEFRKYVMYHSCFREYYSTDNTQYWADASEIDKRVKAYDWRLEKQNDKK
jgi:hypothetical protein